MFYSLVPTLEMEFHTFLLGTGGSCSNQLLLQTEELWSELRMSQWFGNVPKVGLDVSREKGKQPVGEGQANQP